jgi:hypothetical protein
MTTLIKTARVIMLFIILFTSSCARTPASTVQPQELSSQSQQETQTAKSVQVATIEALVAQLTSEAIKKQTSIVTTVEATSTKLPTSTLAPSPTPAVLFTMGPTSTPFIFPTRTPTLPPPPPDYADQTPDCVLTYLTPTVKTPLVQGSDFDAHFKFQNSGLIAWNDDDYEYPKGEKKIMPYLRYLSGTKMQKQADIFDMTAKRVNVGGEVEVVVDMIAPATPGSYFSVWEVYDDNNDRRLCTAILTIRVTQ